MAALVWHDFIVEVLIIGLLRRCIDSRLCLCKMNDMHDEIDAATKTFTCIALTALAHMEITS